MKNNQGDSNEGLNQFFEILNAKGDVGEIQDMIKNPDTEIEKETMQQNSATDRSCLTLFEYCRGRFQYGSYV